MNARTASRGYTAIEVMMALGLLTVGATGIIAIERGALVASGQARDVDVANAIATTWLERLRTDMTGWTRGGFNADAGSDGGSTFAGTLQGTRYFTESVGAALIDRGRQSTDRGWFLPDQGMGVGQSPAFDALGRDLPYLTVATPTPATPVPHFCAHVRIECLSGVTSDAGGPIDPSNCVLVRAQVRVFWPRPNNGATNFCTVANLSNIEDNPQQFSFVYATTALRQNTL